MKARLRIRSVLGALAAVLPLAVLAGCEPTATVTHGAGGPTVAQVQAEPYTGPKKRIAVRRFTDKTAKGWTRIGEGMAEMLATALFETGRFIVLERQAIRDVLAEQDLGASGRIKRGTEAPIGELEGAELLIYGAITEFEPNYRGGGIGLALPRLGGGGAIGIGARQAYVALDLRIVDTRTGRIVAVTKVEGRSTDFGALGGAVVGGGKTRMPVVLGGWKKTPMEKAIRVAIDKAVRFIVSKSF